MLDAGSLVPGLRCSQLPEQLADDYAYGPSSVTQGIVGPRALMHANLKHCGQGPRVHPYYARVAQCKVRTEALDESGTMILDYYQLPAIHYAL